jgi:hypothetical protein
MTKSRRRESGPKILRNVSRRFPAFIRLETAAQGGQVQRKKNLASRKRRVTRRGKMIVSNPSHRIMRSRRMPTMVAMGRIVLVEAASAPFVTPAQSLP